MAAITTKSVAETKKIAAHLARELLRASRPHGDARIIALSGELGAGKTTFAQGFAAALGVKERIKSPTFVLMKIYPLKKNKFRHFVHIDCYRIHSSKDLLHLGIRDIFKDPRAIILIEWPERIKKIIPRDMIWLKCMHGATKRERLIAIYRRDQASPDRGFYFLRFYDMFRV